MLYLIVFGLFDCCLLVTFVYIIKSIYISLSRGGLCLQNFRKYLDPADLAIFCFNTEAKHVDLKGQTSRAQRTPPCPDAFLANQKPLEVLKAGKI